MALPTSTIFDLLDWNSRADDTASADDRKIADAVSGAQVLLNPEDAFSGVSAGTAGLSFSADLSASIAAGALATATYRKVISVPTTYTFEFDVEVSKDLPDNFEDTDKRVFVGVCDKQGYTVGVLFSKKGLALASSPVATPQPILGTSAILLNNDGTAKPSVTIRAVVDGELGRLSLYATSTADAYDVATNYDYGAHTLIATVAATKSTLGVGCVLVACRATAGTDSSITLSSVRLASKKLVVPTKPVAVIEALPTGIVGQPSPLSAVRSSDPEKRKLSYAWEVTSSPLGSGASFEGADAPSVAVGAVVTDNLVTFNHRVVGAKHNGFTVDIVLASEAGEGLSMSLVGTYTVTGVKITLARHASLAQTTTSAFDLVAAFTNPGAPGYNAKVAEVLRASLGDNPANLGHIPTGVYTLSGGQGSTLKDPLFVPDKIGKYVITLKVHNGLRWSDLTTLEQRVLRDDQLLGNRPNCDFMFETLSDFWNLVPDSEVLSTVWSSMAQVTSGELLKLWQTDFSKSIADVPRYYQRRWLDYPLRLRAPLSITLSSSTYPMVALVGTDFLTVEARPLMPATGLLADRLLINTTDASALGVGPAVVVDTTGGAAEVVVSSVAVAEEDLGLGAGKVVVTLAAKTAPAYAVVDSGTRGAFVVPEHTPAALTTNTFTTATGGFAVYDIVVGDSLRVTDSAGNVTTRLITAVEPVVNMPGPPLTAETGPKKLLNTLTVDGAAFEVNKTAFFTWEVLRAHPYAFVHQQPYVQFDKSLALEAQKFQPGDQVEVEYIEPTTSIATRSKVPLLLAKGKRLYPDWRTLVNDLVIISQANFVNSGPGQPVAGDIVKQFYSSDATPVPADLPAIHAAILSSTVAYVYRSESLPTSTDVVSVPFLGSKINTPDYAENAEFTVAGGSISFTPTLKARAVILPTAPSDITLEPGAVFPEDAAAVVVEEGECGVYSIASLSSDRRTATVTHTFSKFCSDAAPVKIRVPRFSHNDATPERLWAELTYFDNAKTIEDNFGVYLGLKSASVESTNIDYLTLVRGAWFAFMSGPSVYNVKLAAQAFVGFPYTERAGQIVSIRENYDTSGLREIGVKEPSTGEVRYYFCNASVPMATNIRTGRPYRAFSLTDADIASKKKKETGTGEDFELDATQLEHKADATVLANEYLVDGIDIYDYINNPKEVRKHLTGESFIQRNHVFLLKIPADKLVASNIHKLYEGLKAFLDNVKPVYTDFIIVLQISLFDSIDVNTAFGFDLKLHLEDSAHTSPFQSATKPGAPTAAENHVDGDSLTTWPVETTFDNNPDDPTWTYPGDVLDKYESSYVAGALDDWSGDGSWNQPHKMVDMVNHLESDFDVINTKLWLPVSKVNSLTHTVGGGDPVTNAHTEFIEGEELSLGIYNTNTNPATWTTLTTCVWEKSPLDAEGNTDTTQNARPIVEYVGSGHHPKVPFNVYSPQNEHPVTYLLLGFNRGTTEHSMGTTNRLKAVALTENPTANAVRGATSGAVAMLRNIRGQNNRPSFAIATDATALEHHFHTPYFLFEKIFDVDKVHTTGPQIETGLTVTQYIPDTGTNIGDFTAGFDLSLSTSNVTPFITTPAPGQDLQYFEHPPTRAANGSVAYSSTYPEKQQLVPSFGPGFFHAWDRKDISTINGSTDANPTLVVTNENHGFSDGDTVIIEGHGAAAVNGEHVLAAGAVTSSISFTLPVQGNGGATGTVGKKVTTTDPLVYGWRDVGDITTSAPATKFLFDVPNGAQPLKNLHVGRKELAHKSQHGTHGFTQFYIPPPTALKLTFLEGMSSLRIEGNFFVAPDTTQIELPWDTADSFSGQVGGSWVFFELTHDLNLATGAKVDSPKAGINFPCHDVVFETGNHPDKTVLGLPGATQKSDGHVLVVEPPGNLPQGFYDIVIRQYRPYVMASGAATSYHMDEAVLTDAYIEFTAPELINEMPNPPWGEGPWGGGPPGP